MLEVRDMSVRYGQLDALRNVSVEVARAEVVCIVGPNGAGKSTLMKAIAGGLKPVGGKVVLDGTTLTAQPPEAIARLGVSLVPEGRHVFPSLTIEENLKIGSHMRKGPPSAAEAIERIFNYFPRLRERSGQPAGKLSGGEQQMLVIGRALMTRPKIMLVDEPSLGLAPKIVENVYDILLELRKAEGLTLLINEQSSERVMRRADRLYVLREGTIQLAGKPADLEQKAIMEAYFGFEQDVGIEERSR